MHYNALAGTLPSEFGMMRELEHLYMQSTAILGTSSSELGQLQSRQQLSLHDNGLCALFGFVHRGYSEVDGDMPSSR